MPIVVNLDVMMARRHKGAGELAEEISVLIYILWDNISNLCNTCYNNFLIRIQINQFDS